MSVVRITADDRLTATLIFSLLFHAVILLGIGFSREDAAPLVPTLDVILIQTESEQTPDAPDFLANRSQLGGGDSERIERPRQPLSSPLPQAQVGIAPAPVEAGAPKPTPQRPSPILTSRHTEVKERNAEAVIAPPPEPLPSSRELIERSLEMARLSSEVERHREAYAKRPRRKFVSANTKEYEFAAYLRGWVARVERIGNLNYPSEARQRNLTGQLVMTVAVRRDGSVERIDIIRPSGYPILDDAALRTVRLAEPFSPLPNSRESVDILHVTRTWQFLPGNLLRNQ